MAGLALGAAVAARFVRRLTRPVLAYGVLELGIAIGALCVPLLIQLVQGLYISVAGGLEAPPETMSLGTALFHLFGSFVVLVPCTSLMGATLPLLARYAVSDDAQVGPRIGVLYAVNTFGAIAGTLVAAFYFLPAFGLRQTVYIGIAGNAVVFLAAWALARGIAGLPPEEAADAPRGPRFHWILPAMTVSGIVSFVYEVLWTRLLGQILGGSTAAFASMLSSFLLGIALGSALAARFATSRAAAARGFALVQLGAGLLGYARVPVCGAAARPGRRRRRQPGEPCSGCGRRRHRPPAGHPLHRRDLPLRRAPARARRGRGRRRSAVGSTPGTPSVRSSAPPWPASSSCPPSALSTPRWSAS